MKWKAYWWNEHNNFGDLLTVPLLQQFGSDARWTVPKMSELLVSGSYLDGHSSTCGGPACKYHLPWRGWTGTIVGTGRLFEGRQPQDLSQAHVYCVRGPLTAREFGIDVPFGDPGLLVPALTGPVTEKLWNVSYIPHWSDSALLDEAYAKGEHIIDVRRSDVRAVAREIAQSNGVVSSSLHGVIVADAYGIPAEPRAHDRMTWLEGGDFKWRDYHGSLGIDSEFGVTREAPRDRVLEMQGTVAEALWSLHP